LATGRASLARKGRVAVNKTRRLRRVLLLSCACVI
jgi:hypothetical protein